MSSDAQHECAWRTCTQNGCVQSINKKDDADKLEDSKGFVVTNETCVTERDYIGLSGTSSTAVSMEETVNLTNPDSSEPAGSKEKETECRDTELRLGIGPYGKEASRLHAHQQCDYVVQSRLHHHHHQHLCPVNHMSQDGSKVQYQCPEGGTGNGPVDFHQSFWPWSPGVLPAGRFMIPVPKVSMVPSKRPYFEVIGENSNSSICTLATNSSSPSDALMQERSNPSAPPLPSPVAPLQGGGGGFYAWSCGNTMPNVARAAWQQENCDKAGMDGAMHTDNLCPSRAFPPSPLYKPSPTPLVNHSNPISPSLVPKSTAAPHFGSSEQRAPHPTDVRKEVASRPKAPMVGWPPVRSFRKNTLQSAAGVKESSASPDLQKQEEVNNANKPAADQLINGSSVKDALFVKAKLDGVRICRKVDLTAYSSYDSLKLALQEMFQGFISNDNSKIDLVHGSSHVLTHEDKDGDWMLAGDVPWRMFVMTVKSLRIMKADDAVGLGKGTNESRRS